MCCGQEILPTHKKQVQKSVNIPVTKTIPTPAQIQVNDNINSQRAAMVQRDNYHRQRFANGG